MQPKVFLKKCSSIQKTLFDMQMSDDAVDILVNLSMLESDVNSCLIMIILRMTLLRLTELRSKKTC